MLRLFLSLWLSLLIFIPSSLWAGDTPAPKSEIKINDYISAAFGGQSPPPKILWVTKDSRKDIKIILQRSNFPLRYRYYRQNNRTVWILNEIGKVRPITTGIIIENNKIIDLNVLTYRESHGSEIRFPAYRNQYNQVTLTKNLRLSKPINGISGATLSTNAMKRVSRLALYLHKEVMEKNIAPSP